MARTMPDTIDELANFHFSIPIFFSANLFRICALNSCCSNSNTNKSYFALYHIENVRVVDEKSRKSFGSERNLLPDANEIILAKRKSASTEYAAGTL